MIGFTRALAREVVDENITVNAITPGFTASETQVGGSDPAYMARMAAMNERKALKRTQMPEDLVGVLLFLLSDASAYITGQTVNVDGGAMMPPCTDAVAYFSSRYSLFLSPIAQAQ